MNKRIQILPHADKALEARLTTEHAASSNGLPVVVVGDQAYGPFDLEAALPRYQINVADGDQDAEVAAARAGYRIYSPLGKS